MTTREVYKAEYLYPGALFPEETCRTLDAPTLSAALRAQPEEAEGYFRRDGWYAVRVLTVAEKLFTASDGEETWVPQGQPRRESWVVGERIHWTDVEDSERNAILRDNIRINSRDGGYGVRTRCGNWQIASDFDHVLEPEKAAA